MEEIKREWQPDERWMVLGPETSARCRYMIRQYVYCRKLAVAQLNRRSSFSRGGASWWAYCGEHLYGREIRDGVVCSYSIVADGVVRRATETGG